MHKNFSKQCMSLNAQLLLLIGILVSPSCFAGELIVSVSDNKEQPLKDVVITLERVGGTNAAELNMPVSVSIEQIDKEFVPAVTVVPVGSLVSFPNRDDILHHVYSFSKAKTFDLPLYKGVPNEPVQFDTAGIATLGCNIHDWMSAHVVVVNTPYYQQTNDLGLVEFKDIPTGDYELVLWHPRQKKPYQESLSISEKAIKKDLNIRLKPSFRSKRKSSNSNDRY